MCILSYEKNATEELFVSDVGLKLSKRKLPRKLESGRQGFGDGGGSGGETVAATEPAQSMGKWD